jgi:hypothetical protein
MVDKTTPLSEKIDQILTEALVIFPSSRAALSAAFVIAWIV